MVTVQRERQAVEAVIREWLAALQANDAQRVKAVWDRNYPHLIYIAEENNDALHGWAGVDGYYNGLSRDVGRADWKIDNLEVDVIGNAAWAYLTFLVEVDIKPFKRTMVFNGRNTFILRKSGGQWKIIHYHESLSRDRSHQTWDWFFKK
jgi:ketosteroid isomerase-like protein